MVNMPDLFADFKFAGYRELRCTTWRVGAGAWLHELRIQDEPLQRQEHRAPTTLDGRNVV